MLREEDKDQATSGSWKTYTRSVSLSELPPRKSNTKPHWNSKARACLPPLQPLSVIRPSIEEWPRAGSDDLGIWPSNPPTPGGGRTVSTTPRDNSSTPDQNPPPEFDCRKDMLAFFDKECSRILDHIYLGSDAIAKNREILRQNGITHVLNCVGFVCPEYFKNDLVYKTLWLQDCPSEDITSILYDVFDYFEDVLRQRGRVFVHCCQGVSRSTSLVIAYLMWKEGQSFDDAFQHVKSARGVTNPNVGFACQLLQCQKRVHALPASPSSVLRMYRMAPHSPYDPLHLVPKMLMEPGSGRLDSRGAFIIQIPSTLFIWVGKHCSPMMSDNARAAAAQVVRYERAHVPVIYVEEGEESFEFWEAFSCGKDFADGDNDSLGLRKLDEYDLDFELFDRAITGGVVPPFSDDTESETCVPARENGWNKLRKKIVKDFIASSKLECGDLQIRGGREMEDNCIELEETELRTNNNLKEVGLPLLDLVDTFCSFFISKPNSDSTSPSISECSTSFTYSPSTSSRSNSSLVGSVGEITCLPSIDEVSQISVNLRNLSEDDVVMEVRCTNFSRLRDEKKYEYEMCNELAESTKLVLYKWPSRCIYVLLLREGSFGIRIADDLCVWIGRDVSSEGSHNGLIKNLDCVGMDCRGRDLLIEEGSSTDAQVYV